MKTKILLVGACLLGFAGLLALPACKSVTSVTTDSNGNSVTNTSRVIDTNRVDRVAKQAAIDGTTEVLGTHPEWRAQFQQAEDDLNILANSPSVSLDDILAIAQRLPVKELKSQTARLSFEGATLTISLLDVPELPATANADIQSIAKSIADGIAQGIATAPPIPAAAAPASK